MRMMFVQRSSLLVSVGIVLLAACGNNDHDSSRVIPTQVPSPSQTPRPTVTSVPESTPAPTACDVCPPETLDLTEGGTGTGLRTSGQGAVTVRGRRPLVSVSNLSLGVGLALPPRGDDLGLSGIEQDPQRCLFVDSVDEGFAGNAARRVVGLETLASCLAPAILEEYLLTGKVKVGDSEESEDFPMPAFRLLPACSNGYDDDGDGKVDFVDSGDPGCSGPEDLSENDSGDCHDGLDNDGDGFVDELDGNCDSCPEICESCTGEDCESCRGRECSEGDSVAAQSGRDFVFLDDELGASVSVQVFLRKERGRAQLLGLPLEPDTTMDLSDFGCEGMTVSAEKWTEFMSELMNEVRICSNTRTGACTDDDDGDEDCLNRITDIQEALEGMDPERSSMDDDTDEDRYGSKALSAFALLAARDVQAPCAGNDEKCKEEPVEEICRRDQSVTCGDNGECEGGVLEGEACANDADCDVVRTANWTKGDCGEELCESSTCIDPRDQNRPCIADFDCSFGPCGRQCLPNYKFRRFDLRRGTPPENRSEPESSGCDPERDECVCLARPADVVQLEGELLSSEGLSGTVLNLTANRLAETGDFVIPASIVLHLEKKLPPGDGPERPPSNPGVLDRGNGSPPDTSRLTSSSRQLDITLTTGAAVASSLIDDGSEPVRACLHGRSAGTGVNLGQSVAEDLVLVAAASFPGASGADQCADEQQVCNPDCAPGQICTEKCECVDPDFPGALLEVVLNAGYRQGVFGSDGSFQLGCPDVAIPGCRCKAAADAVDLTVSGGSSCQLIVGEATDTLRFSSIAADQCGVEMGAGTLGPGDTRIISIQPSIKPVVRCDKLDVEAGNVNRSAAITVLVPKIGVSPTPIALPTPGVSVGDTGRAIEEKQTMTVTISNSGEGILLLSSVGLTGDDASCFCVGTGDLSDCAQSFEFPEGSNSVCTNPGDDSTFCGQGNTGALAVKVRINPTSACAGNRMAQLEVTSTNADAAPVNVSGTVLKPIASVSPTPVALRSVSVNDTARAMEGAVSVKIDNTGEGILLLSSVELVGSNPGCFSLEFPEGSGLTCSNPSEDGLSCLSAEFPAEGNSICTNPNGDTSFCDGRNTESLSVVNVRINPTSDCAGARTARLRIASLNADTISPEVTGTVLNPIVSVAPTAITIPGVSVNDTTNAMGDARSVTISNTGEGILRLSSVGLTGDGASCFCVGTGDLSDCAQSFEFPEGSNSVCTNPGDDSTFCGQGNTDPLAVEVRINPTSACAGNRMAQLVVTSTNADAAAVDVSGAVFEGDLGVVAQRNFGQVSIGESGPPVLIPISNLGGGRLQVNSARLSGGQASCFEFVGQCLAPGDTTGPGCSTQTGCTDGSRCEFFCNSGNCSIETGADANISLRFSPAQGVTCGSEGVKTAQLDIGTAQGEDATVVLVGSAVAPEIVADDVDFGRLSVGSASEMTLSIRVEKPGAIVRLAAIGQPVNSGGVNETCFTRSAEFVDCNRDVNQPCRGRDPGVAGCELRTGDEACLTITMTAAAECLDVDAATLEIATTLGNADPIIANILGDTVAPAIEVAEEGVSDGLSFGGVGVTDPVSAVTRSLEIRNVGEGDSVLDLSSITLFAGNLTTEFGGTMLPCFEVAPDYSNTRPECVRCDLQDGRDGSLQQGCLIAAGEQACLDVTYIANPGCDYLGPFGARDADRLLTVSSNAFVNLATTPMPAGDLVLTPQARALLPLIETTPDAATGISIASVSSGQSTSSVLLVENGERRKCAGDLDVEACSDGSCADGDVCLEAGSLLEVSSVSLDGTNSECFSLNYIPFGSPGCTQADRVGAEGCSVAGGCSIEAGELACLQVTFDSTPGACRGDESGMVSTVLVVESSAQNTPHDPRVRNVLEIDVTASVRRPEIAVDADPGAGVSDLLDFDVVTIGTESETQYLRVFNSGEANSVLSLESITSLDSCVTLGAGGNGCEASCQPEGVCDSLDSLGGCRLGTVSSDCLCVEVSFAGDDACNRFRLAQRAIEVRATNSDPLVVSARVRGVPSTPTPTSTPTNTSTSTPTFTPTSTPTFTPTATPTATPTSTDTPTDTPTSTATSTPSPTPTSTATGTPTATSTDTPTATPSDTPTFT